MSETFPVTPAMLSAYTTWEPPVEATNDMPMSRWLGLVRAAFYGGWLACEKVQPVAEPGTDWKGLAERMARELKNVRPELSDKYVGDAARNERINAVIKDFDKAREGA